MGQREKDVFHGQVVSGEMAGHSIRIEAGRPTGSAGRVYTIVYRSAQVPGRRVLGCVAGRPQLKGYFQDLQMEVEWVGERSPFDPPAPPGQPRRTAPGRWRRARRKIARHKSTRAESTGSDLTPRQPQADDTPLWTVTPLPDGLSRDEMMDIITSSIYDMMYADDSDPRR